MKKNKLLPILTLAILVALTSAGGLGYMLADKKVTHEDIEKYRVTCQRDCDKRFNNKLDSERPLWLACTLGCFMVRCGE